MATTAVLTTARKRPALRVGETAQRPRMTRYEARMIAEELHKLMKQDEQQEAVEWLTIDEASAYLKCSKSRIYNNIAVVPHTKDGHSLKFPKGELSRWMAAGGFTIR